MCQIALDFDHYVIKWIHLRSWISIDSITNQFGKLRPIRLVIEPQRQLDHIRCSIELVLSTGGLIWVSISLIEFIRAN